LALIIVGVAAAMVIGFRLLPYSMRYINLAPAGALLLFAGARLKPGLWFVLALAPMVITDIYFYFVKSWPMSPYVYAAYGVYLLLGWSALRKTESPWRIGGLAFAGSIQFFLISNFGAWMDQVIWPERFTASPLRYTPDLAGLMQCYAAGLEFYRGTFVGDMVFTAALFGAHAWLARACFPAEQVIPAPSSEVVE
jgi:uncharacterized protein DUF6580